MLSWVLLSFVLFFRLSQTCRELESICTEMQEQREFRGCLNLCACGEREHLDQMQEWRESEAQQALTWVPPRRSQSCRHLPFTQFSYFVFLCHATLRCWAMYGEQGRIFSEEGSPHASTGYEVVRLEN